MKASVILRQLIILIMFLACPALAEDNFWETQTPLLCTENFEYLGVGDWFGHRDVNAPLSGGTWAEVDDVSLDRVKGRAIENGSPAGDVASASGIILWDEVEDKHMVGRNVISEGSFSLISRQGR